MKNLENKIIKIILINSPKYDRTHSIKRNTEVFSRKYKMRINYHVNTMPIPLLDNSDDIRHLKRLKPYDLVYEFKLRKDPLH